MPVAPPRPIRHSAEMDEPDQPPAPLEPPRPEEPRTPEEALGVPEGPEIEFLPQVETDPPNWFEFPDGPEPDDAAAAEPEADAEEEPLEEDFPDHPEPLIPPAPRLPRPNGPIQVPPPINWPPAEAPTPLGPAPMPDLERFPRRRPADMPEPVPAPPHPRILRKRRSWGRRILGWLARGLAIFVIVSVLWVIVLRFVGPPITLTMIGDAIGGHGVRKSWMSIDQIDPSMPRAAIAAEDARFCEHGGFDYKAIAAAAVRNASGTRKIRGGSTISQQTAKNVFLWQGGGYFRKGLEAYFTVLIENIWGKKRIMEVYLNVAETGIGTYGVNAGSMRYFGHDASKMTNREAALIAAVLPLPKKRAAIDPKGSTRRYGNSINARIGVVSGDGLDSCLR